MEVRNYINGKFVNSISKKKIPVLNPSNQNLVGSIDEALNPEIDLAFTAATNAFKSRVLQDMDAQDKSKMMRLIASKLRKCKKEGGILLSKENGKTIEQCESEFEGASKIFDYYAGLTDKIENKLIPSGKDTFNYVFLEPFGVSLQIVPWNYPIILFARSVAVSLVIGNTIVIKPPELCPISSNILGKIFEEVDVPKGIINIVHGRGEVTGRKLTKHDNINHIVFTGSPEVASEILKETADRIIPCHLENGRGRRSLYGSTLSAGHSRAGMQSCQGSGCISLHTIFIVTFDLHYKYTCKRDQPAGRDLALGAART